MATTIEVSGALARVEDGVWLCENPTLLEWLNQLQPRCERGVCGYMPDRDGQRARLMLKELGMGSIVEDDPPPEEYVPGRVY